jgi:pimeloyl-ACP methyl ester carboxylesterase
VRTITVGGRSGTGHNAQQIAAALSAAPIDRGRKVILVGYSKGGLDILRFLVDFPERAADVDAVVSIATPVFGTPLADLAAPAYRALLAKLPMEKCPTGDGDVMASLQPDEAVHWLASNPLPEDVRYYSLAAFASRERVARALVPTWKHLGADGQRNDGQVVAIDAVIPGATLLGFANSDHWGIALTTETVHPTLLSRPDPRPFPLEKLLVAVVTFVADDLGRRGADPR